jgi:hypothetical protein
MKKTNRKRANATLRSRSLLCEATQSKALRSTRKVVSGKAVKSRSKASEYVNYLLELHKLQGVLLHRLDKEV